MAAFGAPTVHEDDPERAVRAGLTLLEAVEELNAERGLGLSVRIGVATGEAVVSLGALPAQGEGMLAGDVVNTAARLQTAAPVGRILVGQETYVATRASIEYEPHEPVVAKGKADPIPVWVVVRSRGSVGEDLTDTSRPMIGREDELTQLQRSFTRAVRESSVQLVTIVAEPGLGKSRLVQAFGDWLDSREELVTWRHGRCPPYGDAVAYAALADIVKAQTGILDSDPAEVATTKLDETVQGPGGRDRSGRPGILARRTALAAGGAAGQRSTPGGAVHRLAALPGVPGRHRTASPGARGPPLGRPGAAGVPDPSPGVDRRRPVGDRGDRAARALRQGAVVGCRTSQCEHAHPGPPGRDRERAARRFVAGDPRPPREAPCGAAVQGCG